MRRGSDLVVAAGAKAAFASNRRVQVLHFHHLGRVDALHDQLRDAITLFHYTWRTSKV